MSAVWCRDLRTLTMQKAS